LRSLVIEHNDASELTRSSGDVVRAVGAAKQGESGENRHGRSIDVLLAASRIILQLLH
jgi:hypothetical protein